MLIPFFNRIFKSEHTAELLRGGVYAVFFRMLSFFSGLLITSIIVRYYGVQSYGVYVLFISFWGIGAFAGRFSLDTAVNKYIALHQAAGKFDLIKPTLQKAMRLSLGASVLAALFVFILATPIAIYFFKDASLVVYVRIFCWFIIPITSGMILQSGLGATKKVKSFAFSSFASNNLVVLLLLLVTVFFSRHFFTPVWLAALASVIVWLTAQVLWIKNSTALSAQKLPEGETNKLIQLARPVFFSSVWVVVSHYVPLLLLGYFTDIVQVGLFEGAFRLSKLVIIGLFLVNTIAATKFTELLHKEDNNELQRLLQHKAMIVSGVAVVVFILFLFFPEIWLRLLHEQFAAGRSAFIILGLAQLVNALAGSVNILLTMAGYEKQLMRINMLGVLLSTGLSFILIPSMQLEGAAIARSAGIILVNVAGGIFIYRKIGVLTFWWPFLKSKRD
ncbi:MAG: oligosaccharide flippase family protein [Bacteroidia bacterium]|nr:oligosaccharide flippase family protein [Bacteroidia bacterium]